MPILFNLQSDPNETTKYASSNSKKAKESKKAVADWIAQSGALKPPQKQATKTDEQ